MSASSPHAEVKRRSYERPFSADHRVREIVAYSGHEEGRRSMTPESPTPENANGKAIAFAGPRRILIGEDNELASKQLKKTLEADPALQVEMLPDGQKALDALTQTSFSIVITDLRMPKVAGMELI